jgi:hypothetical protein
MGARKGKEKSGGERESEGERRREKNLGRWFVSPTLSLR